jgi:hypothetical protein
MSQVLEDLNKQLSETRGTREIVKETIRIMRATTVRGRDAESVVKSLGFLAFLATQLEGSAVSLEQELRAAEKAAKEAAKS